MTSPDRDEYRSALDALSEPDTDLDRAEARACAGDSVGHVDACDMCQTGWPYPTCGCCPDCGPERRDCDECKADREQDAADEAAEDAWRGGER